MVRKAGGWALAVSMISIALAGCVGGDPGVGAGGQLPPKPGSWTNPLVMDGAAFSPPMIIDDLRAGGEPVIAITDEGTIIVAAHPGYTHYHPHPVSRELLVPSQTQSYLWRSTDGGESWTHVGLLPADVGNTGPRGMGQGISDPDLTVDANGRVWLTDLEALAAASVSWSDDDGETWLEGNNVASGGAIDRPWLASYGDEAYFTGGYVGTVWPGDGAPTADFIASEDGLVWESRGSTGFCSGDPVANPTTGVIYLACTDGFTYSADGGRTWDRVDGAIIPGSDADDPDRVGCWLCEVGIDAAGTVFQAGEGDDDTIWVSYTMNDGATWAEPLELTQFFPELADDRLSVWPWTSAGSVGRASVTWLSAPGSTGPTSIDDFSAEWHAYSILVIMDENDTQVWPAKLTGEPLHVGAVCQGTTCQVKGPDQPANDRRLGDFFETTISPDGFLHVVYGNTEAFPDDGVSHVAFHKQIAGPPLVVGEVPDGFPTQG